MVAVARGGSPREARRAAFGEGADPFRNLGAALRLELPGARERRVDRAAVDHRRDHLLRGALGEQRSCGEHAGERVDASADQVRVVNLVDQTDAERTFGIDELAGEEQVSGGGPADQLDDPFEGEGRIHDSEPRGRDPETRPAVGDPNVTRDGDLAAAADAEALHDGDRRLRKARERILGDAVRGAVGAAARGIGERRAELPDVRPGAEVIARAAHDEDPNGRIGGELAGEAGEALPHRERDGVPLGGAIEPEGGDGAVARHDQRVARSGGGVVAHPRLSSG